MKGSKVYSSHGSAADEKTMYYEIDRFLGMSVKYSTAGIVRTKIFGMVMGLLFAAIFLCGMKLTDDKNIPMFLMIISLLFGISMLCFYGNKPFPAMENFKKIVEEDGIERIYSDMKASCRIKGSSVYIGGEYVFDQAGALYRLCDVKNVYIDTMKNKISDSFYASMDISGRSGEGKVIIKRLTGITEERRIEQFMEVRSVFDRVKNTGRSL